MSEPQFDPQLLTQMMAANPPRNAHEMRETIDGLAPMLNADLPEVGDFHEKVLVRERAEKAVTADIVVPKGEGPHPVLVYLHGGGWICGSPVTHRKLGYRFAEAGYLVFNVDYRLAPEHPFPAPFDDCLEAVRWASRVAQRYGGDASRLAVGGDSAGGNLSAAVACALADDASAPTIRACLLIYGVFDFARMSQGDPSDPMYEVGRELTEIMVGSYLGRERPPRLLADPRVSPLHVAEKLPPSHVVVGSLDPLAGDAQALVGALQRAGVPHEHIVVEGMPHGFAQMEFLPQARESIDRMVKFLGAHLGR
jgi:acetyl esterase